jgi:hypothetical protein
MVRQLFGLTVHEAVHVLPVTNLANDGIRERLLANAQNPSAPRQFLTFQQLFGGEISLPRSPSSPELSFDATVVEVVPAKTTVGVRLGRYGVIEMQTTDTHGTYRHAVDALRGALDLHADDFGEQVAAHPDWPGRRVEGPNISNVFKRTFYQVMFKFQITRRASSSGCILALPRPVWDSWQPFLGAPELIDMNDGTHRLLAQGDEKTDLSSAAPNWIYVFDIADEPPADGSTTPIKLQLVIATDAPTLSRLALDIAPNNAIGEANTEDTIINALRRRTGNFVPGIE